MVLFVAIDWYGIGKDYCLPLVAPLIAIVVPSILFYVLPARQNRRKTALDFFHAYFSEEMRQTRWEAWKYLVTERKQLPDAGQAKRLLDYIAYATDRSVPPTIASETVHRYQQTARVLHFFALVDTCLREGAVDEAMVRSFLGWDYRLWRDAVLVPLRQLLPASDNPQTMPVWFRELKTFDRVCGVPARP